MTRFSSALFGQRYPAVMRGLEAVRYRAHHDGLPSVVGRGVRGGEMVVGSFRYLAACWCVCMVRGRASCRSRVGAAT